MSYNSRGNRYARYQADKAEHNIGMFFAALGLGFMVLTAIVRGVTDILMTVFSNDILQWVMIVGVICTLFYFCKQVHKEFPVSKEVN